MSKPTLLLLVAASWALAEGRAQAEPMFLSKQYTRCTTCHFSPTGGGLLTPYGRSLSRQELSTTGRSAPGAPAGHEQEFLWGAFGDKLGPVSLGIDMRPAHFNFDFGSTSTDRDMFMTADLIAAFRAKGWTVYGELGREPLATGAKIDSYEFWVGKQTEKGLGFRAGRFLPAYGVRLADHSALSRSGLGFDKYDQVYGLELSRTTERHLLQVSVGPGKADSVNDGDSAFTATARFQTDLSPRSVLVVSGLYRDSSKLEARNGAFGLAYGFAPTPHVNIWTEGDVQWRQGTSGAPAYTLINETAFEVYRGIWLKFSPQLRTEFGDTSAGIFRMLFEADLLPRTHWNIDISYYIDKSRGTDLTFKTFLAQLHLYL